MSSDYASSIQGSVVRVTRLAADGSLASGANASYVTRSFISVSFTPQMEQGEDIAQKAADGSLCVVFQTNDILKNVSLELAICDPDPEFTEILCGGTLFVASGAPTNTLGYAPAVAGTDSNPNGAAVEVWSKAVLNGHQTATNPYWQWVFPYVQVRPSGDRVIENGLLANTFSGWGLGNHMFVDGTHHHTNAAWPFTTSSPYQYARTATIPPESRGYVTIA